ncbi:MAG: condensation domain-containing protein [Pyrinomonadaceae bacterium]
MGPQERILVETMHHIIGDSWSLHILKGELTILYEAFSQGMSSPLKDLTVQYADFAV